MLLVQVRTRGRAKREKETGLRVKPHLIAKLGGTNASISNIHNVALRDVNHGVPRGKNTSLDPERTFYKYRTAFFGRVDVFSMTVY